MSMTTQKERNGEIIVSVLCTVYRHEPYLRQCLDGIVSQQTDFRFEAIVHDDASPDGCRAIIEEYARRYPDLIRPICQTENQYSKTHDLYRSILFPAARGRYIALCEGDDYWTDPRKLQKQVALMESRPECGFCYTSYRIYDQAGGTFRHGDFRAREGRVYDDLLASRFRICTASLLFRRDLVATLPPLDARTYHCGDIYWWYHFSYRSQACCLPDATCVYRILPQSASHFTRCRDRIAFLATSARTRKWFVANCPPRRRAVARRVLKKSQVALCKQALATADYALMQESRPAFFPLMSLKKVGYTLLARWTSGHPERFARLAACYARHLDAKDRRR